MAGGGGGFYRNIDPIEQSQKLRKSEQQSLDKEFEINVSNILSDLLAKYNDRDIESTRKHLDIIKDKLKNELESTIDLVFNGSVARHTYIDGFSDVDALILLDKAMLLNKSPEEVRQQIGELIQERLPKTDVKVGSQAITINFHDMKVQVLPAMKHGDGYRIADESGKNWAHIKPKEFASKLTQVNQNTGGKLVPTIKLAKSIIAHQNPNTQITGYHTESLAIDIFKNYTGEKSTKAMLKHFFSKATDRVLTPIKDRAGNPINVDDNLGSANNLNRRIICNSFDRIAKRMNNADGAQNLEYWKSILGSKS
jgi:hypothetical protein